MIEIEDYNPQWETIFHEVKTIIHNELGDTIVSIEHVGSTSVKGLGAKPILDIDIVIENYSIFPHVVQGLEKLGYFHQGNLGVEDREAFDRKDTSVPWDGKNTLWMKQHLYVCPKDSKELARHLAFRDYLRTHPEAAKQYEQIKRALAEVMKDRTAYSEGKSVFVTEVLNFTNPRLS
jgi:GrpB-like predicted nucleotidyltransferase (UPF0157 family)